MTLPKLILITDGFPYKEGSESYLKSEIDVLRTRFNLEIICHYPKQDTDPFDYNGIKVSVYSEKPTIINYLKVATSPYLYQELFVEFKRTFLLNITKFKVAFKYLLSAFSFSYFLSRKHHNADVYYSYWITAKTFGLCLNNDKFVCSRAHGFDVYFHRHPSSYLPYRKVLFSRVDYLSFISKQGLRYSQSLFNNHDVFHVNYLGLHSINKFIPIREKSEIHLVSCSSVIALKRVNLVVEYLCQTNHIIKWTHIGSGPLLEDLKKLAGQKLDKTHIKYEFLDYMENNEVLKFYVSQQPDLFINVSETEGLPFSIIEAYSCSIPSVATNVGGVKEVLVQKGKFLIDPNGVCGGLEKAIQHYLNLSISEKNKVRRKAYDKWKESFEANANYEKFADDLMDKKDI
jgi:colanic acid/amylovoran biosynthesis glycosyltransferase